MEHKTLGGMSVKSADAGTATAIFSRFGGPPDSDNDITEPGAFTNGAVVAVSSYNHSSALTSALPVGKATIRVLSDRAEADVKFFLTTVAGREAFETVKELGPLVEWSYAYDVLDSEPGKWNGRHVRVLKRLDAYELSPVLKGAGRGTMTVAGSVKSADNARVRAELLAIKSNLAAGEDRLREEVRAIKDRLALCAIKEDLDRQTRRYWSECPPPPAETVDLAWHVLRLCSDDLGVDLPLFRWFATETAPEAAYAEKHGDRDWPHFTTNVAVRGAWQRHVYTVWVAADLPVEQMVATVAHEVAHAAGGDEAAAQTYEKRWTLARRGGDR